MRRLVLLFCCLCTARAQIGVAKLPLTKIGDGYYYVDSTLRNWYDAQLFCRSNNMDLISLETENEQQAISSWLLKNGMRTTDVFYTSGNDDAEEGIFKWTSIGVPYYYFNWLPGEPNNAGGENCMALVNSNGVIGWNDKNCLNLAKYICELPTACWGMD